MSMRQVTAAALTVRDKGTRPAFSAGDLAGAAHPRAADPAQVPARARWWQAWRARFGLAEVCGTLAAIIGFATGYLAAGSLLAAAGLATLCEAIGFYGCVGVKTAVSAGMPAVV